jgi:hypothetical protein
MATHFPGLVHEITLLKSGGVKLVIRGGKYSQYHSSSRNTRNNYLNLNTVQ